MTDKQTGGPAFPRSMYSTNGPFQSSAYSEGYGMNLRDYFAAKALPECIGWGEPDEVCARAYQYADAMLAARNK